MLNGAVFLKARNAVVKSSLRRKLHKMQIRKAKHKSTRSTSFERVLPDDSAAVVRGGEIDLTSESMFFRRQAESAALFGSIVQIRPDVFTLESPFKENFIGSLHGYSYPNMSPRQRVAYALIRHAGRYLKARDLDEAKIPNSVLVAFRNVLGLAVNVAALLLLGVNARCGLPLSFERCER